MRKIMTDKKDNTENGFKDFYFGNNVFNLDKVFKVFMSLCPIYYVHLPLIFIN